MKTVELRGRGATGGTMEGGKLADSSPLHTPALSRWCGEDEEG